MTIDPPQLAIDAAVASAKASPCAKSKRGVAIWEDGPVRAMGRNHQSPPWVCDGSARCRANCGKLCVHAEADALGNARDVRGAQMLHVKVVDGLPVASGPPSCWQCSRHILARGIAYMWLLHDDGWRAYSAEEFHRLTLQHCGLD